MSHSLPRPLELSANSSLSCSRKGCFSFFFLLKSRTFPHQGLREGGTCFLSLVRNTHTHTLYTCSFSFQVHHSLPFLLCSRDGEAAPPNVLDHPSPTSQPSSVPRIPRPASPPPPPAPRPRPRPWQGIPAPFKARNHDSC